MNDLAGLGKSESAEGRQREQTHGARNGYWKPERRVARLVREWPGSGRRCYEGGGPHDGWQGSDSSVQRRHCPVDP